jgi:hypothetical protein
MDHPGREELVRYAPARHEAAGGEEIRRGAGFQPVIIDLDQHWLRGDG